MSSFSVPNSTFELSPTLSLNSFFEPTEKKRKITYKCLNLGFNRWNELPLAIFQTIFSHLNFQNSLSSTLVCKKWNTALKTTSAVFPTLIDVRKIPELIEAGMERCIVPDDGRKAYRHLKAVVNLVGGRKRYYSLPVFNQNQWPEGRSLTRMSMYDLPGPLVRGKTNDGRPFILFCHLNSFDDYENEWAHVGFLVQNDFGCGWRISFGANWPNVKLIRYQDPPITADYFLSEMNGSNELDPGNTDNIISDIIKPMHVLRRLFCRPETSEISVDDVRTRMTQFKIQNRLTVDKGYIVLLDAQRHPMDESEEGE